MNFDPTPLPPVHIVTSDPREDLRGMFMRLHCENEFDAHGLIPRMVETNFSQTKRRGTIRGLHFQLAPSKQGKLVRCFTGQIYDVIVDLRPSSPRFLQYFSMELGQGGIKDAIYVPPGFAHGFQTLTDDVTILYQMTDRYTPNLDCGVRWNDSAFGISWPVGDPILSERDSGYANFTSDLVGGFGSY